MKPDNLLEKYTVAAPRYTSYPTVPYWDKAEFDTQRWKDTVSATFKSSNQRDGISVYIHLPFCESLCTYCGCNTRITKNHNVEEPYIRAVLTEWKLYLNVFKDKPVIKEIHLGGGTPTFFSVENLSALINGILENSDVHPGAEFSFEAHPANTTYQHLETLYKLGFRRLSLGIQDFDPRVQFIINRIQTFEQVKEVTEDARAIGYTSINFDLIYGLPLQTAGGLRKTIEQVSELMPDRIAFYSYAHVPWIKPGQRRFTEQDLPDAATKAELYKLGRNLFVGLGYMEVGMDHFALPTDSLFLADKEGTMHRNFMGYTHQYTQLLIGLGVSSISDSWNAYAQNVKTVEEYLALLQQGELPVFKGHYLTSEDLIIRRHMLNIMCKGNTVWNFTKQPFKSFFASLKRMPELANDGLIEFNAVQLSVTPAGKQYLRNICMALDARLWVDKPSAQLFSIAG
ncbi:oxygen-independent coproporphyrinogen III oxidase [Mucilaginibacter calamicampi]|uniref:Coproporphyrinogen-III oxidase n=1 Tax=Mucilaginibacter calamicampi TaxID=1302352 RepID=A0ABW2YXD3_9SPHI